MFEEMISMVTNWLESKVFSGILKIKIFLDWAARKKYVSKDVFKKSLSDILVKSF